ncbi:hypothetical protein C8J56DRAFT_921543, partial [Mycena floridula]
SDDGSRKFFHQASKAKSACLCFFHSLDPFFLSLNVETPLSHETDVLLPSIDLESASILDGGSSNGISVGSSCDKNPDTSRYRPLSTNHRAIRVSNVQVHRRRAEYNVANGDEICTACIKANRECIVQDDRLRCQGCIEHRINRVPCSRITAKRRARIMKNM